MIIKAGRTYVTKSGTKIDILAKSKYHLGSHCWIGEVQTNGAIVRFDEQGISRDGFHRLYAEKVEVDPPKIDPPITIEVGKTYCTTSFGEKIYIVGMSKINPECFVAESCQTGEHHIFNSNTLAGIVTKEYREPAKKEVTLNLWRKKDTNEISTSLSFLSDEFYELIGAAKVSVTEGQFCGS